MFTVTVVDETTAGGQGEAWNLELPTETLTVRELISRRVRQEVAVYNATAGPVFRGLVQPGDTEARLHGSTPRRVEPDRQVAAALAAFERNGFVLLVDDRQVEGLDTRLDLTAGTEVTFLKLVPLVGG